MIKIINKTDHVIALLVNDTWETFMPQGLSCKIKTSKQNTIVSNGVRFNPLCIESVIELPNKQNDTIIIVERDVAFYIWKTSYRDDVCYLDHPLVRDDKYRSLAAMSLVCIGQPHISYCI